MLGKEGNEIIRLETIKIITMLRFKCTMGMCARKQITWWTYTGGWPELAIDITWEVSGTRPFNQSLFINDMGFFFSLHICTHTSPFPLVKASLTVEKWRNESKPNNYSSIPFPLLDALISHPEMLHDPRSISRV